MRKEDYSADGEEELFSQFSETDLRQPGKNEDRQDRFQRGELMIDR